MLQRLAITQVIDNTVEQDASAQSMLLRPRTPSLFDSIEGSKQEHRLARLGRHTAPSFSVTHELFLQHTASG